MGSERSRGDGYQAAYWAARVTLLNLVPEIELHVRIEAARSIADDCAASDLPDVGSYAGNAVAAAFDVVAEWRGKEPAADEGGEVR